MICLATYDSLDAIPEAMRDEFEQVNGKWQLKKDAIPGVGELFNAALKANETRAVDQVKARNATITGLKAEIELLKNDGAAMNEPGSVVLNPADAKTWAKYTTLGTPKELETKLSEFDEVKAKADKAELKNALETMGKDLGINTEVLADWIAAQPAGSVALAVKETAGKDGKGADIVVKTAMLKLTEDQGNGKTKESEVELLPHVKDKMAGYMYEALTKAPDGKAQTQTQPAPQTAGGVRLPNLSSAAPQSQQPAGGGGERPVDRFNKERASRPSPFSVAAPAGGAK